MANPESRIVRCQTCAQTLMFPDAVWLGLDEAYDAFTDEEIPAVRLYGHFPFHTGCAELAKEVYRDRRGVTEDL